MSKTLVAAIMQGNLAAVSDIVGNKIRSTLKMPSPLEHQRLLGREYIVRKGTLGSEVDYDSAWLLALALRAEVVFDVGANVGQAAMLILQSPRVRELLLVDANPDALTQAADNLVRNQLSERARFWRAFVSEVDDDKVTLWRAWLGPASSQTRSHAGAGATAIEVPTLTLDTMASRLGLHPDLVKMDIEGAEAKALVGATGIARSGKARFIVEMHRTSDLSMRDNARLVLEWCKETGLSAWYLKERKRLDGPEAIERRGRCHLLLQPAAWDFPPWLASLDQGAPLDEALLHSARN